MDSETTAIAPLALDWNDVQRRYLDGEELASIAQDYGITAGAIATRAWRYRWKTQQFKLIEDNKAEVEREVRGSLMVSCLKEARQFQSEDWPREWAARDIAGKCRLRLIDTAARLFGWERDPIDSMKRARAVDV